MYQEAKILFLSCETSLHAGSGDVAAYVDLPIQREKHTGYPKIESSSLKGGLREAFEELEWNKLDPIMLGEDRKKKVQEILKVPFGADNNPDASSSLGFSDAALLLFPIKSMKGTMAWITCTRVLQKFVKHLNLLSTGLNDSYSLSFPEPSIGEVIVSGDELLLMAGITKQVMLEEYAFNVKSDIDLSTIMLKKTTGDVITEVPLLKCLSGVLYPADRYWQEMIENHMVLVSNDVFRDFVQLHTEVVTRNAIDNETGAVKDKALFVEEYLPPESVLYALVTASPEFSKAISRKSFIEIMQYFENSLKLLPVIQLGGNATIGKGIIRTYLISTI